MNTLARRPLHLRVQRPLSFSTTSHVQSDLDDVAFLQTTLREELQTELQTKQRHSSDSELLPPNMFPIFHIRISQSWGKGSYHKTKGLQRLPCRLCTCHLPMSLAPADCFLPLVHKTSPTHL